MRLILNNSYNVYKDDTPTHTVASVSLESDKQDSGNLFIHLNKVVTENDEILELVKKKLYDGLFPVRATNESIEEIKADLLEFKEKTVAEITSKISEMGEMQRLLTLTVNDLLKEEDEADDNGDEDFSEGIEEDGKKDSKGGESNEN
ncbi:DUF1366 domain-containing protein [Gemella sp. GH3]|uniref:DUF1366 domain-containing protein n=1 Tax=unclassified Gemella TaxID=2624949 RepID=UPI0015D0ACDC|nr:MULTISPECIES: DUF1366 domain-containing protein [unclassified Gemella]MBF0714487.1 DUF1366 domain-containing protein [Gemella sp. GH3.1]NYS51439.1 DUF1366 domain-containing protein [Gemella sp. GH3]